MIRYDLRNTETVYPEGTLEALDDAQTLTITVGGVAATLTANAGTLNQSASGFGINSPGGGDATSNIDGDAGDEHVSITFDKDVYVTGVEVSALSGPDEGLLTVGTETPIPISMTGLTSAGGVSLPSGAVLIVAYVAGNGFSLDSIIVEY